MRFSGPIRFGRQISSGYAVTRPFEGPKFGKAELASDARARGRALKCLGEFFPDWIALRQLCLCRDSVAQLSDFSPFGPYRVASALANITADFRAAAS
jgi:hypothetical protein